MKLLTFTVLTLFFSIQSFSKCIVWRHTCCDAYGNEFAYADLFDNANCTDDNAKPGNCQGCSDSCIQLKSYQYINNEPTLIQGTTSPVPMLSINSSYLPNKTLGVIYDPENNLFYIKDFADNEINNLLFVDQIYKPSNAVYRVLRIGDDIKIIVSDGVLDGNNSYVKEYIFNWKYISYHIELIENITPNPSNSDVFINITNDYLCSNSSSLTIELFNANYTTGLISINNPLIQINRGTIPSGFYYVLLRNGNEIVATKTVVFL